MGPLLAAAGAGTGGIGAAATGALMECPVADVRDGEGTTRGRSRAGSFGAARPGEAARLPEKRRNGDGERDSRVEGFPPPCAFSWSPGRCSESTESSATAATGRATPPSLAAAHVSFKAALKRALSAESDWSSASTPPRKVSMARTRPSSSFAILRWAPRCSMSRPPSLVSRA